MSWTRFFRRAAWDEERAREIDAHLAIEIDENVARGMTPDAARDAARRKLGNATLVREEIYRTNTIAVVDSVWRDLRYGARLLRVDFAFAAVAVLSLALGIGANTAIFQLIDVLRLRPLPVAHPHDLADVHIVDMDGARGSFTTWRSSVTYPIWDQLRQRQQALSGLFAWSDADFDLASGGEVRRARGLWVSGEFFHTLGVAAAAGRVFTDADDRRGCGDPGAVLGYGFWQREFGGDRSAVGRFVTVDGRAVPIVGVATAGFFGLEVGRAFDAALPLCAEPWLHGSNSPIDSGTTWWLSMGGRLKPNESFERASAELAAISPALFQTTLPTQYPPVSVPKYLNFTLAAYPASTGVSYLRSSYSDPLTVLLAVSALVLLIACANIANLMLARGSAREREIAVRLALGASRGRVVRQLLAESLLIAIAGASLGFLAARSVAGLLLSLLATQADPIVVDLITDGRVLMFTSALAAATCLLFGLTPALRATNRDAEASIRPGGRGLTAGRERLNLRRGLVVSQVALSLTLLVGALLFARTLRNLMTVDPGFRQTDVVIADVDFSRLHVAADRRNALRQAIVDRVREVAGVSAATDASIVPLSGNSAGNDMWMDDGGVRQPHNVTTARVGSSYFATLGTPLLAGREFNERDTESSPSVAIVNEAFAQKLGGGANPVGRSFWVEKTPREVETRYEIVGLVKNSKYADLREDFYPTAYFARSQDPRRGEQDCILIRSSLSPDALRASVVRKLADVNPEISVEFQEFQTRIRETLLPERLVATLSGSFGLLAAALATLGLYGVMSYTVARRRNEIGIRMALGADGRAVVVMMMREAAALLAIGIAIGTVASFAAGRAVASLLFGLTPHDPATIAAAAVVLAAVALAASYIPARRASRLAPTVALHEE